MKFAIYHREREWTRELGDPRLTEVEALSKEEAERLTAHLGTTGTIAVLVSSPRQDFQLARMSVTTTAPQSLLS